VVVLAVDWAGLVYGTEVVGERDCAEVRFWVLVHGWFII
jgi:hypothetical protein